MKRVAFPLVAALILAVPAAPAGTEAAPEVTDPAHDVFYGPGYAGPKDRDHLDLLGAWFTYDANRDKVNLTMKVADLRDAVAKSKDWYWKYELNATITRVGSAAVSLRFAWNTTADSLGRLGPPASFVWICRGTATCWTEKSSFTSAFAQPGFLNWSLERGTVTGHGDAIAGFRVTAQELFAPGGIPTTIGNLDFANRTGSFDVLHLRPQAAAENETRAEGAENESIPESARPRKGSPGPSIVLAAATLGLVGFLRRTKPI